MSSVNEDVENFNRISEESSKKIEEYDSLISQYEDMKTKIKEKIIPKLNSAKSKISDAKADLISGYDGNALNDKKTSLQTSMGDIQNMIDKLNKVIESIDYHIETTNTYISQEEKKIGDAYEKMRWGK